MHVVIGIICVFAMGAMQAEAANLCDLANGGCGQKCKVVGGAVQCYCTDGWELNHDRRTCHDTNLCNVNNGGCQHICHSNHTDNTVSCKCRKGYEPIPTNKFKCQLINLCSTVGKAGCAQNCYSINGTMVICSCRAGYALDDDNKSCYDINMCAKQNGGCEHKCENIKKGVKCSCNLGYRMKNDKCTDIKEYVPFVREYMLKKDNECAVDNGGCTHYCTNTLESFKCSCKDGYDLGSDNKTCEKWVWYYTLIIILAIFAVLLIVITIWCICGKVKYLAENICCKCFISWKCCMTGLFCKCNNEPEEELTNLYYHQVAIKVSPYKEHFAASEAVPLTEVKEGKPV